MNRRRFVAAVAGAGTFVLAGCTGGADGGAGGQNGDGTPTDEPGDGTDTDTPGSGDGGTAPAIVDRSFERTGDAADAGDRASVTFGDSSVTCTGVIRGRNGCMQAALGGATYEADADELRVRVTTVREGGDSCTQQIVNRGYEATVTFEGGLPGRVVVVHESMDGVRTAAEATRRGRSLKWDGDPAGV
ncbi:hypothetical protein [Halobaculum litoreum]|uniref:hypothetical protein n=1 Tax=Halobaculum litoreum TaxID=3031998 RepID=UPI0024C422F9|nr:hypothetical protein [Halobaculum sp. DT92]